MVLADVGDILATAFSTGLTGIGAFAHIEPVGDGSFTTKDVDLYSLTAAIGTRLTVVTNPAPFVGAVMNTYVRVFDALGTQLAANNDFAGAYSRLTVTLRELGTYFVGISGNPNITYNPNVGGSGVVGSIGDYSIAIQTEAPITWTPQGPGPIQSGQVEGLGSQNNPVTGAVQAVAPHPTNPAILYAASPNGGVWKTTNATTSSPNWTPLTDSLPALSIYALEFDPTDATGNTILAGTGISSSFGSSGNLIGVYKSTDGGGTWTTFSNANGLPGTTDSVRGIAARGSTIVVAMRTNGVYQSINGGATFTKISGLAGSGLPNAGAYNLASDPGNPSRLYVVTTSGVFRSDNTGLNWTNVTPAGSGLTTSTSNAKLTVHNNAGGGTNAVYVGVVNGGVLSNVFRSDNQGATWTAMGIPATPDALGRVISAATNANPIVITTSAHGLATGQQVLISSARGNAAANGVWTVTFVDADRFSLDGSAGNGTYVANSGVWTSAFPITNATNASPIVITTAAAHGLANGNVITIAGANGNTAANGFWSVSVINATTFSLNSSAGNGAYTSGGVWSRATTLQPNQGSIHDPEGPMRPQGFAAPPVPEGVEQPGGQGNIHFSLVADPNNPSLMYIAGDRQDTPFPNAIGAQNYTGRLFRGDFSQPAGNRWTPMTHNFADADGVGVGVPGTAPHADSRDMAFDANGNLVEADDGGVYRRTSPQTSAGVWTSVIGNLAVTEAHSASYDPITQRFISGHQDTGTAFQSAIGSSTWDQVAQADGGVTQVAVEGANSVQYFSFQNHGSWRRRTLNAAGTVIGTNTLQGRVTIGVNNVTVFGMPDDSLQFYGPYRINPTNPARMALGSDNYIYESFNRGDDFVRVPSPAVNIASEFIRSVAYGHPGNLDVIYAGGNVAATELMVRTTAGGSLVNIGGNFPGSFTAGLAIDPDDWQTLYVLDFNGRLWRTTDAGATVGNWIELTGNVTPLLGNRRSLSVLDGEASDILLVGGVNGVFAMNTATPGVWYEVGHNLPNAPAHDVRGYSASSLISLGTLGRGVWSVSSTNTAFDSTAPGLPTITRVVPSPASAGSVYFQLTFAEPVAGVSLSNLALVTTGVSGAAITGITGGGTTWIVAVGTGTGDGTIGLDWVGPGSVTDVAGNPLAVGTVTGPTELSVTTTIPAANSVVSVPPTVFTVNVSDAIDVSTLDATDFSVNGVAATSLFYVPGTTTLTFTFAVTPVISQGLQTMHLDADAFVSAIDGGSVPQFDATFRYDATLLQVTSTLPPFPGGIFTLPAPLTLDMHFNEPITTSSVQTTDLVLSGIAGAFVSGVSFPSGDSMARFTISGIGATTQGTLNASIAAGAINDAFGNPNGAFAASYQVVDTVAPRVISTSVAPNAVLAPSALTYVVTFSEPMSQTGFTNSAFSLRGVSRNVTLTPTTVVWNAASTVLTLTYNTLSDDNYTLTLNSGTSGATFRDVANNALDGEITGALPSGNGTAGGNAVLPFIVDIGSERLGPLLRNDPPGSLIYDPSLSRVIAFAGDNDDFTFAVDPGQKITVVVTPSTQVPNTLRPSVTLKDPSSAILATNTAPAAAQKALLQSISTTAGGTYTISVTGAASSTGLYTIQLILNASAEVESNNTVGTAQDIDDSFLTLATAEASAQRGAVMGTTDAGSYLVSTPAFSFTDISTTGTIRFNNGVNNSTIGIGLGWNFNLFGIDYPTVFFNDNGLATFISSTSSGANATLSANPTQAAIAPFWDDLLVSNSAANASVRTQSFGATPNRQFVIQWDKVTFASGGDSSDPITFQLILNEANSSFQFNYLDLVSDSAPGNNGGGATVGAKTVNPTNGKFIELSSDNASSPYLGAGQSVLFTPIANTADYYAFDLAAGQSTTLALTGQLPGNLNLELRRLTTDSPPEEILAMGDGSATNATKIITSYTAAADGTYYARIIGDGNIPYSLVVTRNAAFGAEPNNTPATAQDLTGKQGAFGDLEMTTLTVSDSGWWDNTGFHDTANKNYIATATGAIRDFFVLDLSGITQTITGAALQLQNPTTGVGGTPTYTVFDVSTPIATLQASNSGQTAIYNDLGTGTQYGSRTFATTDNATLSSVVFNAAGIAALNAARGSQLAVGGAITSASGFVFSSTGSGNIRQLLLSFAPEDWYSIDVSAASPNIRLETKTPADGSFQFVNNLNPHIELYDPSGALVTAPPAILTALPDGRNESIAYHASGLSPGTYRVRVMTDTGSPGGEYFLGATTLPNASPLAFNDDATTDEDTDVVIDVVVNDTDDFSVDPATVSASSPTHGSVVVNLVTGKITYTPALNYSGSDSFTYTLRDDNGAISNVAAVNLTVIAVADPPSVHVDDALGDEAAAIPLSIAIGLVDTDGSESLVNEVEISGVPEFAVLSSGTNNGSGVWTLTLAQLVGLTLTTPDDDAFTLTVRAIAREGSNGDEDSTIASLDVTVNNVAPRNVVLNSGAINENDTFTLSGSFDDPGTLDTHTVVITWAPGDETTINLAAGVTTFSASRQYLDDDPSGTEADTYPIGVTVTDNHNATAAASTTVTVNNVAPTITGLGATNTVEMVPTTLTGTIGDVGTLDTFTVFIDWGNGTQTFHNVAAGAFSYTHQYLDDNAADSYEISLTVTDDDTGTVTAGTSVTVLNLPPTATANNYSTTQAVSVLGNVITDNTGSGSDSDPAGANDPLTVSAHTDPSNGTLVLNTDGSFSYQPDSTFAGTDSFTYTISDGDGGSSTATVTIVVAPAALGSILTVIDTCLDGTALLITGTSADDTIVVGPGSSSAALKVTINDVVSIVPKPSGRIIITGGDGNDKLQIVIAVSNPVWLYGDAGNDRLYAGSGGSLLIGGDGDDNLTGGGGRDILIGGQGADNLVGNSANDILVASSTTKDDRSAAGHEEFWCNVWAEWNSANSFADRVQNLRNGTGGSPHNNGSLLLPNVVDSLFSDRQIDKLIGGAGDDWLIFLASEDQTMGSVDASN